MKRINANKAVTVSDLERRTAAVIDLANKEVVAVLNRNRVMAYFIPPAVYEFVLEQLDDIHLVGIINSRAEEKSEQVDIESL